MKRLLIHLAAASLMLTAARAEESARSSFDAGLKVFATSNFPAASNAFLEAAAAAPAEKLDPAAAFYNAALAANEADDAAAAADLFARAATSSDLQLQAKAYYNRGNTLFQQSGGPTSPLPPATPMPAPALEAAGDSIGEAIQMYENAIALNPADEDAKANYELAVLKQQQIQQQQKDQQKQDQKDQKQQEDQKQDQKQQDQKQDQQQQNQQDKKQNQQAQQAQQNKPQQQGKESPIEQEKPSEQMTPEEATMMLDAMKAQEQSQRDQLHPFFGRPVPVEKDW